MKEHGEREYAALKAEVAALQQQVRELAAHLATVNGPARWGVSKSLKFVLLPVCLLLAAAGVLYGNDALNALFIDKDGKVGIGTTAPAAKLEVSLVNPQVWSGDLRGLRLLSPDPNYSLDISAHVIAGGNVGYQFSPRKVTTSNLGLEITTYGNVGIGTQRPSERLEVKGVVAADGFRTSAGVSFQSALVPIGTIMAYGGDTLNADIVKKLSEQGWLPCNGAAVSRTGYDDLFKAIGSAFGAGDTTTTFNVPDLRGRFPRGTNQNTGRDPDAAGRRAEPAGGNSLDKVGSVQDDELRSHTHGYTETYYVDKDGNMSGRHWSVKASQTQATGGNETRPKNIYVNWIIKAKHT